MTGQSHIKQWHHILFPGQICKPQPHPMRETLRQLHGSQVWQNRKGLSFKTAEKASNGIILDLQSLIRSFIIDPQAQYPSRQVLAARCRACLKITLYYWTWGAPPQTMKIRSYRRLTFSIILGQGWIPSGITYSLFKILNCLSQAELKTRTLESCTGHRGPSRPPALQ